jgi:hypothetical protein
VTVCAKGITRVIAVKVPLDWPAATVTVAGTETTSLELLNEMAAALAAAFDKDTVHWLDALLDKFVGEQTT